MNIYVLIPSFLSFELRSRALSIRIDVDEDEYRDTLVESRMLTA